ncbi:MAG: hypothetical protein MJ198_03305 [Bacteroidales bacterium]|nr:hypothetical protein [Bacteroidales bacterium]
MNVKHFCIFILFLCFLSGCDKNPYHKNISGIDADFQTIPFHTEIKKAALNSSDDEFNKLQKKYGDFLNTYISDIRQIMRIPDSCSNKEVLKTFVSDTWINELYQLSDSVLTENQDVWNKKISQALKYYKYYFPDKEIPDFYTFISGVNYSMAIDSNIIAIGIDKYLGANCDFYNSMIMESYIKKNMIPEKVPADVMRAMAESEFPEKFDEDYLLAIMLQHGRYQYFVKCMLPDEPDSLLWGFSAKQMVFCEKSEGEFWKYLISTDNILFTTDYMTQKRFIDDGPFTIVFSKDSPARVGQWIGFKIIESFMQNNPDVSLEELFSIQSSKEIMSKAKYNPK